MGKLERSRQWKFYGKWRDTIEKHAAYYTADTARQALEETAHPDRKVGVDHGSQSLGHCL